MSDIDQDISLDNVTLPESTLDTTEEFRIDEGVDDISERIKQIEEEAKKIRELQQHIDINFDTGSSSSNPQLNLSIEEKQAKDLVSVFVGNVSFIF